MYLIALLPCREPIAFRTNPTRIPPTMAKSKVTNKATKKWIAGHFNLRLHPQDSTLDFLYPRLFGRELFKSYIYG